MTKREQQVLWDGLTGEQKAEAEKIFQEKRDQLFKWHAEEQEKVYAKLKEDGKFRTGLDANSDQVEVMELSAEYQRRFAALPTECIRIVMNRIKE